MIKTHTYKLRIKKAKIAQNLSRLTISRNFQSFNDRFISEYSHIRIVRIRYTLGC